MAAEGEAPPLDDLQQTEPVAPLVLTLSPLANLALYRSLLETACAGLPSHYIAMVQALKPLRELLHIPAHHHHIILVRVCYVNLISSPSLIDAPPLLIPLLAACCEYFYTKLTKCLQANPPDRDTADGHAVDECIQFPFALSPQAFDVLTLLADLFHGLRHYHQGSGQVVAQLVRAAYHAMAVKDIIHAIGKDKCSTRTPVRLSSVDYCSLLSSVSAALQALMRESVANFYRSFFPDPPNPVDIIIAEQERVSNQRLTLAQFFSTGAPSVDASLVQSSGSVKLMNQWTDKEWRVFSAGLCELITIEFNEFLPAFENLRLLSFNPAAVTLSHVCSLFNRDVSEFEAAREKAEKGIDEIALTVLECLSRVRLHLMHFSSHLSHSDRLSIVSAFPDLSALARAAFDRWLANQAAKLAHWRERLIQADQWEAIDEHTHYSESLNDQFAILSTIVEAFFVHLRTIAVPVGPVLQSLLNILNDCVIRYARYLIEECGEIPADTQPRSSRSDKYKQSGASSTSVFAALKKKIGQPASGAVLVLDTSARSFASHSLSSFLVKLSCAVEAKNKIGDLARQLQSHLEELEQAQREEADKRMAFGVALEAWADWGLETPATLDFTPSSVSSGFSLSLAELSSSSVPRLMDFISCYVVWVELRDYFLQSLYFPSAASGMRIRGSLFNNHLDRLMSAIYTQIERPLFPSLVLSVFKRLIAAWRYCLLFGRRCVEREDGERIIADDLFCLEEMFGAHCDDGELADEWAGLHRLVDAIKRDTEQLIELSEGRRANDTQLDQDTIIRILSLRGGPRVAKVVRAHRDKQKAREKLEDKGRRATAG